MRLEAHVYNWKLIRMVYRAYERNDTKIAVPFEPKVYYSKIEYKTQTHSNCTHHSDIRNHLHHFITSNSYIHKLHHISDLVTYITTSCKLHLAWASYPHPSKYNTMDRKVCKNPKKITYARRVFLNYYT